MFRRKEDGTEILDEMLESENDNESVVGGESVSAPFNPGDTGRATMPSAPVAAGQPLFRPSTPAVTPAQVRNTSVAAPSNGNGASNVSPNQMSAPVKATTPKSSKRVLTVGPDIQMKGEITTCDRVVIEGTVDATLTDVHTVELAQSGSLKGTAEVEDAEISGVFEGDLIVRGRLIIYSTGLIRGNITYGEIEIERGGKISGSIRNVDEAEGSGKSAKHARAA